VSGRILIQRAITCNLKGVLHRVALVLGNGDYRNVAPRANAVGDAHAIAALLKSVGFDVIEASDVKREQFSERLREFAGQADVLLCRPEPRAERRELPSSRRCGGQIRDGYQAGRRALP
jgi:hypothetical protein